MTAIILLCFRAECRLLQLAGIRLLVENAAFKAEDRSNKNRYQPGVFSNGAAPFEAASYPCSHPYRREPREKTTIQLNLVYTR
jgi:hypothetical protein